MEKQILELFLFNTKLKFSQIEKALKTRSNKLDYHLKKLIKDDILKKEGENYELKETSEHLIPYISEKKSVLPVILIKIGTNKKVYLYRREKRPYKEKLSLPGGRLLLGEDIPQATKRIMLEKHKIKAKFLKVESISLEQIFKKKKLVHSFLLIVVSAKAKESLPLTNIRKNEKKIIKSDLILIKQKTPSEIKIKKIKIES